MPKILRNNPEKMVDEADERGGSGARAEPDGAASGATTGHQTRFGGRGRKFGVRRFVPWIGLLVAWEMLATLRGQTTGTEETIPSIEAVAQAVPLLANYWDGGLGVTSTAEGGEVTWQGVLLGLSYNSAITGSRLVSGLALGSALGIALAVSVSWSRTLREAVAPVAHFARMIPLLAMVPLFILWFGTRDRGVILFIAFTTFVLLFVITLNAIDNVPSHYIHYARSLGASSRRVYFSVILPATLPQLRGGFLLAVGFGWSAAVAGELLSQQTGLGRIIVSASFFGRTSLMALIGLIVIAYAAASYFAAAWLLAKLTRWSE